MKGKMKKKFVLGVLFVFPLLVYLFFASGKNNFAKLPTLTYSIQTLPINKDFSNRSVALKDRISILGYWGGNLSNKKAEALNLNEKIFKRFNGFDDFQFVFFVNEENEEEVQALKNALQIGTGIDLSNWYFLPSSSKQIQSHFQSLKTPYQLNQQFSTPYVFIIDKNLNLRGRNDDGELYGFDARSVAEISKKMIDDVKVILAEYRLALKIYNSDRKK
tara:strand:- start:14095 stop:14748 length:654 start_codon:yes stop_codon:yes gene_type:complete